MGCPTQILFRLKKGILFVWAKRNFILEDQTGWTSNFVCVFFMHFLLYWLLPIDLSQERAASQPLVLKCRRASRCIGCSGVSGLLYWPLPIDLSQERAVLIEEAEQSSHNSASSKSASRAEVQEGKQVAGQSGPKEAKAATRAGRRLGPRPAGEPAST